MHVDMLPATQMSGGSSRRDVSHTPGAVRRTVGRIVLPTRSHMYQTVRRTAPGVCDTSLRDDPPLIRDANSHRINPLDAHP
jgi:hypothetical protein